MPANDKRIRMTLRLERPLYLVLRDYCRDAGATHNRIIERAIKLYLTKERLEASKKLRA